MKALPVLPSCQQLANLEPNAAAELRSHLDQVRQRLSAARTAKEIDAARKAVSRAERRWREYFGECQGVPR